MRGRGLRNGKEKKGGREGERRSRREGIMKWKVKETR